MPIRYHAEYFDFPQDMDLPVHKELPPEFEASPLWPWEARTKLNRDAQGKVIRPIPELLFMTKCWHCEGWVPGKPREHDINNLDGRGRCGRRGTEYYCPRCAKEVHFSGIMS